MGGPPKGCGSEGETQKGVGQEGWPEGWGNPNELQRNEKSMMCLTCLFALCVDSVSWEGDWRDAT